MARSAEAVTVVVALAVLLGSTGSGVGDDTTAVSVIEPSIVVVTTIVTVAVPASGRAPIGQVTTPANSEQLPWVGVAETNVMEPDPGRVSVTTTPVASEGPRLVTVRV